MPTIFSHAIAAAAVAHAYPERRLPPRFLGVDSGVLDAPGCGRHRLPVRNPLRRHAGASRPLALFFFAAVVGIVVAAFYGERSVRRVWLAVYFALVTASHALLDALTDGGLGVALLAPFSNERFFLPWRPIEVSPIGPGFFSARGVSVIASELRWIWVPSAIFVAAVSLRRVYVGPASAGRYDGKK